MSEDQLTEKQRETLRHYRAGLNVTETARAMGRHPSNVSRDRQILRDRGFDVRSRADRKCPLARYGHPLGYLGPSIAALDRDTRQWIAEQIPEGGTVAEFAVGCIVDTYLAEREYPPMTLRSRRAQKQKGEE